MAAILAVAHKDVLLVLRDKFALFWLFGFPMMYALFFGAIFGGGDGDGARSKIPVAVVDEDGSEAPRAFAERLSEHDALRVVTVGSDDEGDAEVEPAAVPVSESIDDVRDAVRLGECVAYVRIPVGYGDSPFALFDSGDSGDGASALEVGIDPSRAAEAGMLRGVLTQSLFEGLSDAFTDRDFLRAEVARARDEVREADDLGTGQKLVLSQFLSALDGFLADVDLEVMEEGMGDFGGGGGLIELVDVTREERGDRPHSAFEITFPTATVWGLMTVALTFAITLVREQNQGTLLRLRIAPLSRAQLLAGKALACFVTCEIVLLFLMGFAFLFLDVRFSSIGLVALAMASTSICFTGLMMTASVLGRTEQAVAGAAWGVMMPFAMIGGGMIPLIAMPSWLLALSDYSPFKWGIYSMEGAVWRGFDVGQMLGPCGILVGLGAAFFTFGVWMFRRLHG